MSDTTRTADRPKPKTRRFQFSLRTLLVFVTLCAFACSWYAVKVHRIRRHQEAMAAIEKSGAKVRRNYPYEPEVIRKEDSPPACPPGFYRVDFDPVKATDADLEHFHHLTEVRELELLGSPITDAGLEHLKYLTRLRLLGLGESRVTDGGLKHLEGFRDLETLDLRRTQITDAGVKHLQTLRKLGVLGIEETRITDSGLDELRALSELKYLYLHGTQVTDEGVKKFRQTVPGCEIKR